MKGIAADIVEEVFRRADWPYSITCIPWQRALYMVKNGEADGTIKVSLNKSNPDPDSGLSLPSGDFICLSLSDDGSGIPPEKIRKIFEPYFTTREIGKGTGLELSVVHGIVKNYNRDIQVKSQPDTQK